MKKNVWDVRYYQNELTDEFSGSEIQARKIDGDYRYHRSPFLSSVVLALFKPFAFWYLRHQFRHRIQNRKILKPYRKKGYFLYGNHTQPTGDAFIPAFLVRPGKMGVIVHPDNVSMPFLGRLTPYLGALPLPGDFKAMHHFLHEMDWKLKHHQPIVIYPEAHIWPYYTKIRPFVDTSFRYPVERNLPSFVFVNAYTKRKNGKVRITTYVDGPFFSDASLPLPDRKKKLRDEVYQAMVRLATQYSDYETIRYVKKEEQE